MSLHSGEIIPAGATSPPACSYLSEDNKNMSNGKLDNVNEEEEEEQQQTTRGGIETNLNSKEFQNDGKDDQETVAGTTMPSKPSSPTTRLNLMSATRTNNTLLGDGISGSATARAVTILETVAVVDDGGGDNSITNSNVTPSCTSLSFSSNSPSFAFSFSSSPLKAPNDYTNNGLPRWLNAFFDKIAMKDQKLSRTLVMATIIFFPIFAFLVNTFLSYRLDPAGFFSEHSTWKYTTTIRRLRDSYTLLWWVHKISSYVWTCAIVIQVLLVIHWGKVKRVHEIFGSIVILTALSTATTGLIMQSQHELRYDTFTKSFNIFASVCTYTSCAGFFVAKCFTVTIRGRHVRHHYFGYPLMIGPVGMLLQLVVYSIGLFIKGAIAKNIAEANKNDYAWWKASLWVCMPVACAIALLCIANTHYWRSRAECERRRLRNRCNSTAAILGGGRNGSIISSGSLDGRAGNDSIAGAVTGIDGDGREMIKIGAGV